MELPALGYAPLDDEHAVLEVLRRGCLVETVPPARLLEATREHFEAEEQRMRDLAFKGFDEHHGEHRRLLGEMERMLRAPRPLRRAWLRDGLPEALQLHILRLDAQIAPLLNATDGTQLAS